MRSTGIPRISFWRYKFNPHTDKAFQPVRYSTRNPFCTRRGKNVSNCASWRHLAPDFPPVWYHDFGAFLTASDNTDIGSRPLFLPAALRAAQACRYLIYSETDFQVFRPVGATRCTDGGEIYHGGGDQTSPPTRQISPPSVQRQGCRTPKIEIFTQI